MTNQKEIRYLCLRVFVAQGDEEYQVRVAELRTALRKTVHDARNLGMFLIMKPQLHAVGAPEPARKEQFGLAHKKKINQAKPVAASR